MMKEEGRSKPFSFKDAVFNSGPKVTNMENDWEREDFEL